MLADIFLKIITRPHYHNIILSYYISPPINNIILLYIFINNEYLNEY